MIAYQRLGDWDEAMELSQTFSSGVPATVPAPDPDAFGGWVRMITHRLAVQSV